MAYTETIHQSWGSRLGNSFRGVLFGLVLFVAAFPVLFRNEGRAVRRAKALEEGAGAVVTVDAASALPENAGKLVHLTGAATTPSVLVDDVFGVSTNALALRRRVEMYQWEETEKETEKKKIGGSVDTVIEYGYRKVWSDEPIDSSSFKEPAGHENPSFWQAESAESFAEPVFAGAFRLPEGSARSVSGEGVPVRFSPADPLPAGSPPGLIRVPQGLYWSVAAAAAPAAPAPAPAETNAPAVAAAAAETNAPAVAAAAEPAPAAAAAWPQPPATPSIGDMRATLTVAPLGDVSVVGRQAGSGFEPSIEAFVASNGGRILLLAKGRRSADEMFEAAKQANRFLTWLLRAVGFFLMYSGLRALFSPLATLADVLPFLGRIVSAGAGFVSGVLALALSFATVGLAWLFYRPLLGVPLLVAAVALVVWLARRRSAEKPAAAA